MRNFLKPTKRKIALAIILSIVFFYIGSMHILVGKHTPLSGINAPIYSHIITIITLWPLAILFIPVGFVTFVMILKSIIAFLFLALYYYFLSCLWFYKKDTWKIKNYLLLVVVVIIIFLSVLANYNSNKTNCLGLNENDCRLKENCVPSFSTQRIYEFVGSKNYESVIVFLQCEYMQEEYKNCDKIYRSDIEGVPEECIIR